MPTRVFPCCLLLSFDGSLVELSDVWQQSEMGAQVLWCADCSYSWATVRDVAGSNTPHCTRCSGNRTRYNGKPFVTPGSTDAGNDENGIRRLLKQFLSTLLEDKRAMVRAAMGMEEVVQMTPKQISLKELSAKRAQVERRQEELAKRIIDTQKKLESFTQKLQDLSNEKCKITPEFAQRAADLQKLDATEYKPTSVETMEVEQPPPENLTEDQKNFCMEQAEANASSTRAGNALHNKRRCTTKTQPLEEIDFEPPDPTQGPTQAAQGRNEDFPTSRHSLHNWTENPPWPERDDITCLS